MADVSARVKGASDLKTYDDVIAYYEWITGCMRRTSFSADQCEPDISFSIGKTDYNCNNIDEFKRLAHGQRISIISFTVSFFDSCDDQVFFDIHEKSRFFARPDNVSVSCSSQPLLNEILNRLSAEMSKTD